MYIRLLPATFEPLTKEIMKYRYIFKIFLVGKLLIELSQNSQTLETAYWVDNSELPIKKIYKVPGLKVSLKS